MRSRKRHQRVGTGSPQTSAVGGWPVRPDLPPFSGAPRRRPLFYDRWRELAAEQWATADRPYEDDPWTVGDLFFMERHRIAIRPFLEDGHAATVVLIVGLALLFGLAIAVPAIRALQEALGVLS